MATVEESKGIDFGGIQVCVRARPLNDRERDGGYRNCISFDEATHQVVLSAVDKSTLMQLRGQTAKGYAFDRRFGPEHTSDNIYDDCVCHLVENLFKGYNATVLAYGQTGSGKTLTMSGGKGIFGNTETGIIRRAAEHILKHVQAVEAKQKPGESISVRAYALELYNEELRDLSSKAQSSAAAQDKEGSKEEGVRIAERPVGKDGRCVPEVVGVTMVEVQDAESLVNFFADCFDNRAVAATKMNDRSSRSHAIYTVLLNRTIVDVSEGGDKVRTAKLESRFNLVDLAGSERVKRSGVTGAAFKEAVHINGGLLALGNVIVALSGGQDGPDEEAGGDKAGKLNTGGSAVAAKPPKPKHIPYRDSKLTRLLQDSLGGSALTVLIACISSCEADFEETNSTLKYANRACKIKNTPVANNQLLLEEDLLPLLPSNGTGGSNISMMQMQMLLAEHNKMKEAREKREQEKREKEEKRLAELKALREAESKAPGYQRLRMAQYDELRKKLVSSHGGKLAKGEVINDEYLAGFKRRETSETEAGSENGSAPSYMRPISARGASPVNGKPARPSSARLYSNHKVCTSSNSPLDSHTRSATPTPDSLVVEGEDGDEPVAVDDAEQQQQAETEQAVDRLQQVGEVHDMAAGTDSASANPAFTSSFKQRQQKMELVTADEGTCTTPGRDDTIKAVYASPVSVSRATSSTTAALGQQLTSIDHATSGIPAAYTVDRTVSAASAAFIDSAAAAYSQPGAAVAPAAAVPPRPAANSYAASHSAAFEVLEFNAVPAAQPAAEVQQVSVPDPEPVPVPPPQLLARFRVNHTDTLAVFRAVSVEDFADVASLLPPNTALPAADKMTYLLARLEVHPYTSEQLCSILDQVASGSIGISSAVGPAVGCLMATFGTSLITDCIFDFEDPEQLAEVGLHQRLELWGLQIPHTSIRPTLSSSDDSKTPANRSPSPQPQRISSASPEVTPRRPSATHGGSGALPASSGPASRRASACSGMQSPLQSQYSSPLEQQPAMQAEQVTCWSSTDRLNVSIGLMYALCNLAKELGAAAGFCVPRPQLLRRWLQSGVKMKQVQPPTKLIYPPSAHDYTYYKSSTVAYFLVDEVKESLSKVLSMIKQNTAA